jgi:hypothetical protein
MKILLAGIFYWCFANISAEQVITCKKEIFDGVPGCRFSGVTLGPNENVSIKTDPEDADVNSITWVEFSESSIHSVPPEIFKKFPDLERFDAGGQNIQEIKADTFRDGRNLQRIDLARNALTFLHPDTFEGKILIHLIC